MVILPVKNNNQRGFIEIISAITLTVLLVGLAVSSYLAGQRQDIRNRAAYPDTNTTINLNIIPTGGEETANMAVNQTTNTTENTTANVTVDTTNTENMTTNVTTADSTNITGNTTINISTDITNNQTINTTGDTTIKKDVTLNDTNNIVVNQTADQTTNKTENATTNSEENESEARRIRANQDWWRRQQEAADRKREAAEAAAREQAQEAENKRLADISAANARRLEEEADRQKQQEEEARIQAVKDKQALEEERLREEQARQEAEQKRIVDEKAKEIAQRDFFNREELEEKLLTQKVAQEAKSTNQLPDEAKDKSIPPNSFPVVVTSDNTTSDETNNEITDNTLDWWMQQDEAERERQQRENQKLALDKAQKQREAEAEQKRLSDLAQANAQRQLADAQANKKAAETSTQFTLPNEWGLSYPIENSKDQTPQTTQQTTTKSIDWSFVSTGRNDLGTKITSNLNHAFNPDESRSDFGSRAFALTDTLLLGGLSNYLLTNVEQNAQGTAWNNPERVKAAIQLGGTAVTEVGAGGAALAYGLPALGVGTAPSLSTSVVPALSDVALNAYVQGSIALANAPSVVQTAVQLANPAGMVLTAYECSQGNQEACAGGFAMGSQYLGELSAMGIAIRTNLKSSINKGTQAVLYHGTDEPLVLKNITTDELMLKGKESSSTLGSGIYTTDSINAAKQYALLRSQTYSSDTPTLATLKIKSDTNILDLATPEMKNNPIPHDLATEWQKYVIREYIPPSGQGAFLDKIYTDQKQAYLEYLEALPSKVSITELIGTPYKFGGSPPWSDTFTEFMLFQGYHGLSAWEPVEGAIGISAKSVVLYDPSIVTSVKNKMLSSPIK